MAGFDVPPEVIRSNTPPDLAAERLNRALDSVEAPWPRREENQLRLAFEAEFDGDSSAKARALIESIEKIGVEPFRPPEPLPPIEPEEVQLI